MSKGPVWVFKIVDVPALADVWRQFLELCFIPADFDVGAYEKHLAQPHIQSAYAELDALPSAERIAAEYAACARDLEAPRVATRPLSRLQPKNGVVKLGPGMNLQQRLRLRDTISAFFRAPVIESGNYLYPPGGFKEWHTNMGSMPGWRMYIIHKLQEGNSFFRYVDPDTMTLKTLWDEDGQVNIFRVSPDRPFWHAVSSVDTYRWSKGFIIPDCWQTVFPPNG